MPDLGHNYVRSTGPEIYEGSEDLQRKIRRSSKCVLLTCYIVQGCNKLPTMRLNQTES